MSRLRATTLLTTSLAATALAVPAIAHAQTSTPQIARTQNVRVADHVLSHGNVVAARVTVTNPDSKVDGWWSQQTVRTVVRKGVDGRYEMPYNAEGYRCTPIVGGPGQLTVRFTCKLQGADLPTAVRIAFTVRYVQS